MSYKAMANFNMLMAQFMKANGNYLMVKKQNMVKGFSK
jgi:hypothetical protein